MYDDFAEDAWIGTHVGYEDESTHRTFSRPFACQTLASPWASHATKFSQVHPAWRPSNAVRSEEHTSELQSRRDLVCRLLLEKKKKYNRLDPVAVPRDHPGPLAVDFQHHCFILSRVARY